MAVGLSTVLTSQLSLDDGHEAATMDDCICRRGPMWFATSALLICLAREADMTIPVQCQELADQLAQMQTDLPGLQQDVAEAVGGAAKSAATGKVREQLHKIEAKQQELDRCLGIVRPPPAMGPQRLPTTVRRNVASLTAEERGRFRDALLELHRRQPRGDIVSWWFKQDQSHVTAGVHSSASFLPWHRELVNRLEALLQDIDPGVALHYWDWTTNPRRSPDGAGYVDLMTEQFMGSAAGSMGAPFESFYDPDANPNRDTPNPPAVPMSAQQRAALPPPDVTRMMPASGHTPREVNFAELDQSVNRVPPPPDGDATVHDDDRVLADGFVGSPVEQFEQLWRAVEVAHGWAHQYVGGTISAVHYSFRDPFVFLLHSNLDRLWASWQLNRNAGDTTQATWRLDPNQVYGGLAFGAAALPDPAVESWLATLPFGALTKEEVDQRREDSRRLVGQEAHVELTNDMPPWNGGGRGGAPGILPWSVAPERRTPQNPNVVRPPLYDRYVHDDQLCASWATMRLGRPLPAGDVIEATIDLGAVDQDSVEFVLEAHPDAFWWKGLRLPELASGDAVRLWTENDRRSDRATIPASQVHDGQELLFEKAVRFYLLFTRRYLVYRLADLGWVPPGSRVIFLWRQG